MKLAKSGFVRIPSDTLIPNLDVPEEELASFINSWNDLSSDTYMADGGDYRLRRHATFSAARSGGPVQLEQHQPHYQTTNYNSLNGGVKRHFAPVKHETVENLALKAILTFCSRTFGSLSPLNDWHIELHQFRILAKENAGKPTPEGVHQDGVDFVMMSLISRESVIDGETRVHDLNGNEVARFTLTKPMETVLVNDRRVAHGVTPILPAKVGVSGYRDMLVVTFKRK
ncbi:2OG-Fe dioxygenase family protein [Ahrensia kielensis]|uniref:2OG-Fe dioxygenase family protein n=1 Tax=Ahrensia kielensis TaxID=76980 RepID=UPI0003A7B4CD|nr:2OG-Fe dioxygenase family protein [Ahrensia kielensis]